MALDPRQFGRKDWELRYQLFDKFALADQRNYYNAKKDQFRKASDQVNRVRATLALFTGIASALAGFIMQIFFAQNAMCDGVNAANYCDAVRVIIVILTILSVALPALAALFNTLSDLYQWDKTIDIYENASQTIEYADALSPLTDEDDAQYRAALKAYSEGVLAVVNDETAQWGGSIRTPAQLEKFVEDQKQRASEVVTTTTKQV